MYYVYIQGVKTNNAKRKKHKDEIYKKKLKRPNYTGNGEKVIYPVYPVNVIYEPE